MFELPLGAHEEGMPWSAVVLGFDREVDSPLPHELAVSVNGANCSYPAVVSPGEPPADLPYIAEPRMSIPIPARTLGAGRNRVAVASTAGKGSIVWCEIYLG